MIRLPNNTTFLLLITFLALTTSIEHCPEGQYFDIDIQKCTEGNGLESLFLGNQEQIKKPTRLLQPDPPEAPDRWHDEEWENGEYYSNCGFFLEGYCYTNELKNNKWYPFCGYYYYGDCYDEEEDWAEEDDEEEEEEEEDDDEEHRDSDDDEKDKPKDNDDSSALQWYVFLCIGLGAVVLVLTTILIMIKCNKNKQQITPAKGQQVAVQKSVTPNNTTDGQPFNEPKLDTVQMNGANGGGVQPADMKNMGGMYPNINDSNMQMGNGSDLNQSQLNMTGANLLNPNAGNQNLDHSNMFSNPDEASQFYSNQQQANSVNLNFQNNIDLEKREDMAPPLHDEREHAKMVK